MKVKKYYYMPFHVVVRNNNVEGALRQLNKTLEANEFFDEIISASVVPPALQIIRSAFI